MAGSERAPDSAGPPLRGKVALVTGAAGGMGRAVCERLAADGARVVGLDRQGVEPERGDPEPIAGWACDVGEEAEVRQAIAEVGERTGRLDFVVHCAAIPQGNVTWKLPVDEWDRILRVNLRSAFLLAHYAIPLMRSGGAGGRIVLIGSTSGSTGRFGQCAYAASKAGLLGLAKSVARETARYDILVNVIEPGVIRTPMSLAMPDGLREQAIAATPLGRMGEPADIAAAVRFLCGPEGRHITGQILRVDGGEYM
jgi:NAD(P)-dependent dehydrogenase (short-subunit alcohol dehydrogenase family)